MPDQVRTEQFVLETHSDHVNDLTGIKVRYRLAYRTDPATGPTGETAVEMLPARQTDDL
jgi:hypothetical protein